MESRLKKLLFSREHIHLLLVIGTCLFSFMETGIGVVFKVLQTPESDVAAD